MKPKFEGGLIGHFSRRKIRDVMAFAAGHELHHVLSRFGSKGFEFELECDRRGAGHAVNAGFRPRGGPYFFEWRLERNRDSYTPGEIDSEQERILRLITVYRKILTQRDYNRFRDNIELPQARIEEIVTSQSAFAASQRTR